MRRLLLATAVSLFLSCGPVLASSDAGCEAVLAVPAQGAPLPIAPEIAPGTWAAGEVVDFDQAMRVARCGIAATPGNVPVVPGAPVPAMPVAPLQPVAVDGGAAASAATTASVTLPAAPATPGTPATATTAPGAVVDPGSYQPRTEFDNTPWRFNMEQDGRRMTADEFTAWMEARGVRVAKGASRPVASQNPTADGRPPNWSSATAGEVGATGQVTVPAPQAPVPSPAETAPGATGVPASTTVVPATTPTTTTTVPATTATVPPTATTTVVVPAAEPVEPVPPASSEAPEDGDGDGDGDADADAPTPPR